MSGEKYPLFQKIVFHSEDKGTMIFENVGQNIRPSANAHIPEDVKVSKAATIPSNLIKLDSTKRKLPQPAFWKHFVINERVAFTRHFYSLLLRFRRILSGIAYFKSWYKNLQRLETNIIKYLKLRCGQCERLSC